MRDLLTAVRIGIHAHEQEAPQRLLVNLSLEGEIPLRPATVKDCIDYDHIHAFVTQEWPSRPHVELLETLAGELVDFCFMQDSRLLRLTVSITKPDVFPNAAQVGVELTKTRNDWEEERRVTHGH